MALNAAKKKKGAKGGGGGGFAKRGGGGKGASNDDDIQEGEDVMDFAGGMDVDELVKLLEEEGGLEKLRRMGIEVLASRAPRRPNTSFMCTSPVSLFSNLHWRHFSVPYSSSPCVVLTAAAGLIS